MKSPRLIHSIQILSITTFLLQCTLIQSFLTPNTPNTPLSSKQIKLKPLNAKKPKKQTNTNSKYDFAIQELRYTLTSIKKQIENVSYQQISQSKQRNDIESYIYTVAENNLSPIPLNSISSNNSILLIGKWKLIFSTEETVITNLPKEARIVLDIKDNQNLDYILQFTKRIFALKKLVAKSTYTINDAGVMQYEYNDIVADVFGMSVPTGLFGMLKGRVNYVRSIYFDGNIWIEGGFDNVSQRDYFNAYVRDE